MGALEVHVLGLILSMHTHGNLDQFSLQEEKTSYKNGFFPSAVSGRVSNVLRDILNQESMVRFSMVQKLQNLVMDAIDGKSDRQVIKTKLIEVTKELQDLEKKIQIMEEENAKYKEDLKVVNGTVNDNGNSTKEDIQYLDQIIKRKTFALQDENRKLVLKNADFEKQLILTSKKMESDFKKDIQNTVEKIKALNESLIVSTKSPSIEVLEYQLNEMNDALQKCSVNSLFERVKKTEETFERFSVSVNDTLHTICRDLNESSWILSKGDTLDYHNGMMFSTKDQDNDRYGDDNCAIPCHGAWWYKSCQYSNLNREYALTALSGVKYPIWECWKRYEALKQTVMMIRHSN